MDDCPRQRADQSCDARDFARDDSARLRRCGSEEISRIQIWGIFREHGIFGVARRFRNASLVAARNLRIGAAHCMRQPGEPDARPRQCTRAADHHPPGPWSVALANDSRTALRKRSACGRWHGLWTVPGVRDKPDACGSYQHAAESNLPGSRHGLACADFHDGARGADNCVLRAGAGRACHAGRARHLVAIGQPGNVRWPRAVQSAAHSGGFASGGVRCAVDGGATLCQKSAQLDDAECRFPTKRNSGH